MYQSSGYVLVSFIIFLQSFWSFSISSYFKFKIIRSSYLFDKLNLMTISKRFYVLLSELNFSNNFQYDFRVMPCNFILLTFHFSVKRFLIFIVLWKLMFLWRFNIFFYHSLNVFTFFLCNFYYGFFCIHMLYFRLMIL